MSPIPSEKAVWEDITDSEPEEEYFKKRNITPVGKEHRPRKSTLSSSIESGQICHSGIKSEVENRKLMLLTEFEGEKGKVTQMGIIHGRVANSSPYLRKSTCKRQSIEQMAKMPESNKDDPLDERARPVNDGRLSSIVEKRMVNELASTLSRQSQLKLSMLQFSDLVRTAFGLRCTAVESLASQYEMLGYTIHQYSSRTLRHPSALREALARIDADFIVLKAIESASSVSSRSGSMVRLLHDLFIEPLEDVLAASTSLKSVLQQMTILGHRFKFYQTLDVDWAQPLETNMDFFWRLQWLPPRKFAEVLTMDDSISLRQLNTRILCGKSPRPRRRVGVRWNALCRSVEECLVTDVGVGDAIERLANELEKKNNFFSLSAIVQGAVAGRSLHSLVRRFEYLIDSGANYKRSQDSTDLTPQLLNVFAAISSSQRGDLTLADRVLITSQLYPDEKTSRHISSRKREMGFSCPTPRNSKDDYKYHTPDESGAQPSLAPNMLYGLPGTALGQVQEEQPGGLAYKLWRFLLGGCL
ncbi:hypothetical protein N7528_009218 [Penicillium herquei]|nr:hypothetical protein N7528_009218 [Penicillium herquei]